MMPSFFKKSRYKTFDYAPRYYDESKEKMKERYERIAAEIEGKSSTFSEENFRSNLRENWRRNKKTSSPQAQSMIRMVLIAIILIVISYYYLMA